MARTKNLVPLRKLRDGVWGIRPRNKEQHFALDLLLCDDIKLVTLVGKAGTGKTMLAIAAGLQKVVEEQLYSKLLVSRPIFPLGRDIGYLPGDIEEKLNPWMQPIYDNVEFLMGLSKTERKNGRSYQELIDLGYIEIEPLTYIRGRSIPNQFIIVDEAQNLTPHEVKTIITRAGEGTKIVLTGDPYQIDNPVRRRHVERPHHRGGEVQGRARRRPRDAVEGRALAARRAGLEPALIPCPRPRLSAIPGSTLRAGRIEPSEVAAEAVGDQVLDTVVRAIQPFSGAANLAAVELALLEGAEVLLEAGEAVGPQRGGAIDVAQSPGRSWLRQAEDHAPLELVGPSRQPVATAAGALPKLLPLGQLDDRPLHHAIVVHAGPRRAVLAGTWGRSVHLSILPVGLGGVESVLHFIRGIARHDAATGGRA